MTNTRVTRRMKMKRKSTRRRWWVLVEDRREAEEEESIRSMRNRWINKLEMRKRIDNGKRR